MILFGCFWEFGARYCEHRFGESWHLSAEGSLLRHAGVTTIPDQVAVRSEGASHHVVNLPGSTSLLHLVATDAAEPADVALDDDGIRLLSIDAARVRASERFFRAHEVAVMAVLGQFCFAYIHPYPDGNGRLARFIMNILLASGGYPWTVARVEDRRVYMEALEHASVGQTIEPFAEFIAERVAGAASGPGR